MIESAGSFGAGGASVTLTKGVVGLSLAAGGTYNAWTTTFAGGHLRQRVVGTTQTWSGNGTLTANTEFAALAGASSAATLIYSGTLALGNSTLTLNPNFNGANLASINLNNVVSGNGNIEVKTGIFGTAGGVATLGAANTFSGTATTFQNSGTLALNHVNALQNATLDTGSSGTQSVTFTLSGTNTYNIGTLTGSDALAIGGNTLSVGAKAGTSTFSAAIGVTSASGGLTKVGAGSFLTLTGSSIYIGATTVSAGTLIVGVAGVGSLGNTAVAVNNSGTLGGSGTILGSVTINSGGHLAPGNSPGNLTAGSLVLNAGAVLDYELGAVANSDKTTLTAASASLNITGNTTINLTSLAGFSNGTYTLIDYNGTGNTANLASLTFGTKPSSFLGRLVNDTANTNVNLEVGLIDYSTGTVGSPDASLTITGSNPNYNIANANFESTPKQSGSISVTFADQPSALQYVLLDLTGNIGISELSAALTASGYNFYTLSNDPLNIVHGYQYVKDYDIALALTPSPNTNPFHFTFDVSQINSGSVSFENIAVVPEPGAFTLIGASSIRIIAGRRRRRPPR